MQPVASLKTFIKTNNLTDIWRNFNQDKQQFTWRRKDKTQASRIDMIFIGTYFFSLVETCKIKPVTIQSTDHQSVYINFIPGVSEKGRGYWKINNSILQEVEYQLLINNLIDKYIYDKVNNNVDGRLLWDVLKIEIREATMIYCKSKSKFKREARRSLEKELQDLSSHRDSLDITDESLDKRINDIEKELEQIYNQKAKGAQIRSREKWLELGEQK